jgi:hypothetical protein
MLTTRPPFRRCASACDSHATATSAAEGEHLQRIDRGSAGDRRTAGDELHGDALCLVEAELIGDVEAGELCLVEPLQLHAHDRQLGLRQCLVELPDGTGQSQRKREHGPSAALRWHDRPRERT